jgi:hypothetical protein
MQNPIIKIYFYFLVGPIIGYVLTEGALGTGNGYFEFLDWQLKIEAALRNG